MKRITKAVLLLAALLIVTAFVRTIPSEPKLEFKVTIIDSISPQYEFFVYSCGRLVVVKKSATVGVVIEKASAIPKKVLEKWVSLSEEAFTTDALPGYPGLYVFLEIGGEYKRPALWKNEPMVQLLEDLVVYSPIAIETQGGELLFYPESSA